MTVPNPFAVGLIEDDDNLRHALTQLLKSSGLASLAFANAEEFLAHGAGNDVGCLLLDVRLPGMGGLELLETLPRRHQYIPTIVLTAYADVPLAVRAMRSGAFDFFEKPYREETLLARVRQALDRFELLQIFLSERRSILPRIEALTTRELQVLDLIAAGRSSRQIAADLGVSIRTFDVHRANILRKLETKSTADLVRWRLMSQVDPFGIYPSV